MLVKVVNDNVHPYTEKYRGQVIHIPAKGSITMDLNEASHFLGTNPGTAQVDANGIPKPESYKMLRIEKDISSKPETTKKFVCMADGREFHSQKELDAYIAANHTDAMIDEDAKEKITGKAKRGRPRKGVAGDTSVDNGGGETQV